MNCYIYPKNKYLLLLLLSNKYARLKAKKKRKTYKYIVLKLNLPYN